VKKKKMKKTIAISTAVVAILVLSVGAVAAAYSPGTLVGPADGDRGLFTATLPTVAAPISYIDTNANLRCDIGEYVYVDVSVPTGRVSQGDIRLMDVIIGAITYKAGTQVLNLDLDVGNPLLALAWALQHDILIVDADANGLYSVGDWLYLDINGDSLVTGSSIALGADLRLTAVDIPFGPAYAFGTKVKTLDNDVGIIPLGIMRRNLLQWSLDYIDNVGPATYTPGDTVYFKLPLPAHATINVMTCDLRITEYPY
jgi:hypothetical protein